MKKNTGKLSDKLSLDNIYVVSDNILALAGAKVDAYIATTGKEVFSNEMSDSLLTIM